MSPPTIRLRACLTLTLLLGPTRLEAQSTGSHPVQVTAGGGLLTSGAYFTGPGDLALSAGDAFAGTLEVSVAVHRSLALVLGGSYARSDWRVSGIPLFGSASVPGADLWFGKVALRGQLLLGGASAIGPVAFLQAGPALAHYAVRGSFLGTAVDENATNFAVAVGGGVTFPLTERLGIEALIQDYIASFKSVRDLAAFGIEGRRAHTLLLAVGARIGL
jgi:hypothetical protein